MACQKIHSASRGVRRPHGSNVPPSIRTADNAERRWTPCGVGPAALPRRAASRSKTLRQERHVVTESQIAPWLSKLVPYLMQGNPTPHVFYDVGMLQVLRFSRLPEHRGGGAHVIHGFLQKVLHFEGPPQYSHIQTRLDQAPAPCGSGPCHTPG